MLFSLVNIEKIFSCTFHVNCKMAYIPAAWSEIQCKKSDYHLNFLGCIHVVFYITLFFLFVSFRLKKKKFIKIVNTFFTEISILKNDYFEIIQTIIIILIK